MQPVYITLAIVALIACGIFGLLDTRADIKAIFQRRPHRSASTASLRILAKNLRNKIETAEHRKHEYQLAGWWTMYDAEGEYIADRAQELYPIERELELRGIALEA